MADKMLYRKTDLELMTTYQLREICRQNKLMNGVITPLDKEELIGVIMRSMGRMEELFITEVDVEGLERLANFFAGCRLLIKPAEDIQCNSILTAYREVSIDIADAYTIPYHSQLASTNAFVMSESGMLCTILNIREKQGDTKRLYLTKTGEMEAREVNRKGYALYCVNKRTSDEIYRLYMGRLSKVPEHIEVWKVPLIDFQVRKPIILSMPMSIDFGSVNTTAGVYLDAAYMERMGRTADILGLKGNAVNYTLFDDNEKDSMPLSEEERKLVKHYRVYPEMHKAVKKLLEMD